jgi:Heterokaryon incompatibility protein (HET)
MDRCPPYFALSHCWGKALDGPSITTENTLASHTTGISIAELPLTFQDSILITRNLGARYLWIDALCIIQDSKPDWENEAAKMGAIYSRALLTISVDLSSDASGGCFNPSRKQNSLSLLSNTPERSGNAAEVSTILTDGRRSCLSIFDNTLATKVLPAHSEPAQLKATPLSRRAWTYQERILSPRILHYTSTMLFWECRLGYRAQDNIMTWHHVPSTVCGKAAELERSSNPLSEWKMICKWYDEILTSTYVRRQLTVASDKLPALSAISRLLHRHIHGSYLAGLWSRHLEIGLAWQRMGSTTPPTPPVYRCPSWSWASQDTPVFWPLSEVVSQDTLPYTSHINVETSHVDLDGPDTFGRVRAGWLTISGHVRRAHVRKHPTVHPISPKAWALSTAGDLSLVSEHGKELGSSVMDDDEREQEVDCMLLITDFGPLGTGPEKHRVLLLSSGAAATQLGYVRKGLATLSDDSSYRWFLESPLKTVTIY